jgi:hypothetical protein
MSYQLAVSLILAMISTIVVWAGSLVFDYNLARQLVLVAIISIVVYLIVDFKETVLVDEG